MASPTDRPRTRALSLTQPWAWLIVHGPKRIENRRWHLPQKWRGQRVLVHAAKGMTLDDYASARSMTAGIDPHLRLPAKDELARGKIIGAMTFGEECLCPARTFVPSGFDLRWWMEGQHGFLVASVEAFATPVECKGALGFWEVPPGVLESLGER